MAGDKRPENPFGFKRITDYSDAELKQAVGIAVEHCKSAEIDFYAVLRGIDAYMEKRRRRNAAAERK